jgi:hypothetical protein
MPGEGGGHTTGIIPTSGTYQPQTTRTIPHGRRALHTAPNLGHGSNAGTAVSRALAATADPPTGALRQIVLAFCVVDMVLRQFRQPHRDHRAGKGAGVMVSGMATKKVTVTLEEGQLDRIRALVTAGTTGESWYC